MALLAVSTALVATAVTTAAAAPAPTSSISLSVSKGASTYNVKKLTAKPGLIRIDFANNSTAAHNVSIEHGGEFEYGATLTIRKGMTTSFLTLAKGTYHLYSSIGKDEDKGMAATLLVK